ncbi:MAG: ATP-dependent 6-phosphofructokinase, partial [Deltaproteobacteria bacterium]|nr:ATP-dependent 6-phosphofructokinase [Deltaproteobacteria bacterium]
MNEVFIGKDIDTQISCLGNPGIYSPVKSTKIFIDDTEKVLIDTTLKSILEYSKKKKDLPYFERAGARRKIFFDPSKTKCGVVTCGGLCPGVNDVIRNIVLELHYMYGVENIYGIPYG